MTPIKWLDSKISIKFQFLSIKAATGVVLLQKVFFKNSRKFTGKHLCQSLFFNKVAGLRLETLLKRIWHRCFLVNFAEFLRTPSDDYQILLKDEMTKTSKSSERLITLHKKWSFLLQISSVNMTKFAVSCGFGHIYWRNA